MMKGTKNLSKSLKKGLQPFHSLNARQFLTDFYFQVWTFCPRCILSPTTSFPHNRVLSMITLLCLTFPLVSFVWQKPSLSPHIFFLIFSTLFPDISCRGFCFFFSFSSFSIFFLFFTCKKFRFCRLERWRASIQTSWCYYLQLRQTIAPCNFSDFQRFSNFGYVYEQKKKKKRSRRFFVVTIIHLIHSVQMARLYGAVVVEH